MKIVAVLPIEVTGSEVDAFFSDKTKTKRKLDMILNEKRVQGLFDRCVFEELKEKASFTILKDEEVFKSKCEMQKELKQFIQIKVMYFALKSYISERKEISDEVTFEMLSEILVMTIMQEFRKAMLKCLDIEDDEQMEEQFSQRGNMLLN